MGICPIPYGAKGPNIVYRKKLIVVFQFTLNTVTNIVWAVWRVTSFRAMDRLGAEAGSERTYFYVKVSKRSAGLTPDYTYAVPILYQCRTFLLLGVTLPGLFTRYRL